MEGKRMNKKLFLAALLVAVMTSFNVVFADSVEIGNIIASENLAQFSMSKSVLIEGWDIANE